MPSAISPENGPKRQCPWSPGGTTSVWPAKTRVRRLVADARVEIGDVGRAGLGKNDLLRREARCLQEVRQNVERAVIARRDRGTADQSARHMSSAGGAFICASPEGSARKPSSIDIQIATKKREARTRSGIQSAACPPSAAPANGRRQRQQRQRQKAGERRRPAAIAPSFGAQIVEGIGDQQNGEGIDQQIDISGERRQVEQARSSSPRCARARAPASRA